MKQMDTACIEKSMHNFLYNINFAILLVQTNFEDHHRQEVAGCFIRKAEKMRNKRNFKHEMADSLFIVQSF